MQKNQTRRGSAVRHELFDDTLIGITQDRCATGVADEFVGTFDHAMAFASLCHTYFAGAGQLEALLDAGLRFQLGHFALNSLIERNQAATACPDDRTHRDL